MDTLKFKLRQSRRRVPLLLAALAAGVLAPHAVAGDVHWNVPDGSWQHTGNWSLGAAPGPNDTAYIAFSLGGNTGTARVVSNVGSVARVEVRKGNTVSVEHRGVLNVTGDMNLGLADAGFVRVSSSSPTPFDPATLNVGGHLRVGLNDGSGRIDQSADFVNVTGNVILGASNLPTNPGPPSGFYNLTGGRLTVGGTVFVGGDATGSSAHFDIRSPAVAQLHGITSNSMGSVNHIGGEVYLGQGGLVFPHVAAGGTFMRYTLHDGTFASARVTVNSAGEWQIRGGFASAGRLAVNGGRIVITEPGPQMIQTINVAVTDALGEIGFIDVNEGGLTTESQGDVSSEAVRVLIQRGYRDGLWTSGGGAGTHRGITSRAAGATVNTAHKTAIGYADTIDLSFAPGEGGGPDGGSTIIVKHTYYGDANLDGAVNLLDFNKLAANFGTADKFWVDGDFNYDRIVNLADFNLLAANFGLSAAGPDVTAQDWATLAAAVPEPASLPALASIAFSSAVARRRKR